MRVTSRARITVLALAAVILVAAFSVARGAGDDEDGGTPQAQTQTQSSQPADPAATQATEPDAQAEAAPVKPAFETIRLEGGENATGDAQDVKVDKGDTVRMRFTSDEALEIHIHGYDEYVDVPAGGSKRVSFKADADGIYEIENHGNGALVARLEVQP